ncbi:MFS transporter [Comamonas testosteroni]|uniref:Major facilitator superfamily MFS_1 n=1 Tax=Comamonas testosteroni (strain DSM 14576 / KF-1) TaxID=399795 RepID=B7WS69_COMTK|nr:MFS transporter [Comamonas testosteroni]EED65327.1 major facilitator superfamily MFS_1 [Comamonas testosteroni KF-1]WQG68738.1 MFS transporter [Comamonas testosteroni]
MQSRLSPYAWVCFSMCVGVMGTALASPLYPLYQQAWDLQPSHITQIFVTYMLGALISLLFLGRLTNLFGFLKVLRLGLMVMTMGVIGSALSWNTWSLGASRFIIGLASGLITTSASIGMTQLNNKGDLQRAAATTSLTIAFGFGLGPVVGGLMAQWAPFPLVSSYLPPIALSFLGIHALFRIQLPATTAPVHSAPGLTLKDVLPSISQPRKPFIYHYALGCMAAFSAFGMFSLFAAMAPSFMAQMLPWHGPAVSGLSIGFILFLSAGIQLIARPYPTKRLIIIGFFALAATNALLVLNLFAGSPWLFALSVLSMSCGHALCNLSGMAVVNKVSKPVNRTGLLSTYLVVGYVGTIVPILGMGWLSDHIGLTGALIAFCACLGLLSALLGVISARARVLPVPRQ